MANKKVQKAGKAAQTARSNPYVQRLIDDEDLRKNIVQAYESARVVMLFAIAGGEPSAMSVARKYRPGVCGSCALRGRH